MAMFLALLLFAALNVTLGFGLAVYLSQATFSLPTWPAGWRRGVGQAADPNVSQTPAAIRRGDGPEDLPQVLAKRGESTASARESAAASPSPRKTDDAAPARQSAVVSRAPRGKRPTEAVLEQFGESLEQFAAQLTQLDQQMRRHAEANDAARIKQTLDDLHRVSAQCLEGHDQTMQRLAEPAAETWTQVEEFRQSLLEHGRLVRSTDDELQRLVLDDNARAEMQRALGQSVKIVNANCEVREQLMNALLNWADEHAADTQLASDLRSDSMTGLLSKAGVHDALADCWCADDRSAPVSAAMIDIDNFREFNKTYGAAAGDAALREVADIVSSNLQLGWRAGRYLAGTFVLLMPRCAPRHATAEVERIRQTIEAARFIVGDAEAGLTASCSVVQSNADDTPESFFERGLDTIHEARRYGRNRTFLNEGNQPAPVLPPNLTIQPRKIVVLAAPSGEPAAAAEPAAAL